MALDENAVRRLVLSELAKQGERYVPVGVSARHVHLSAADAAALFGPGHSLTPIRPLSQPGQFASAEQVRLIGPKGTLEKVRVLGPVRAETQVEITLTDALRLGIPNAPVRMSGKLENTPGIRLAGPAGEISINRGVIVAARHLHMSGAEAAAYGVHDGMVVSVRLGGARPCVLENVVCRTGEGHALELHLDTDEANACGVGSGDYGELILPGNCCKGDCRHCGGCGTETKAEPQKEPRAESAPPPSPAPPQPEALELVTEQDIRDAARRGRAFVSCVRAALVTPSAADLAAELGIEIRRAAPVHVPSKPRQEPERVVLDLVTETDINDAFRDDRSAVYCLPRAIVTDAAQDRAIETGVKIVRVKE